MTACYLVERLTKVNETNRLVQNIARQNEPEQSENEKKARNARTLIVRKHVDIKLRSSKDIRKVMNKKFPGEVIRNARTTAGGSLLLELDDEETAKRVKEGWNNNLFGGNAGVVNLTENPAAGIIRNVFRDDDEDEVTEEEIAAEINKSYENAQLDFFKKDDEFTGTIKIVFNKNEDLVKAMKNPIKIFEQRYRVEEYEYRPRVIKCNYCQRFGHVSRVCRSREKGKPVCGKCTSSNHETKDCTEVPAGYKCAHCDGKHETGDKDCEIFRYKLEEIRNRGRHV